MRWSYIISAYEKHKLVLTKTVTKNVATKKL